VISGADPITRVFQRNLMCVRIIFEGDGAHKSE
jgi:hypothetical protein